MKKVKMVVIVESLLTEKDYKKLNTIIRINHVSRWHED